MAWWLRAHEIVVACARRREASDGSPIRYRLANGELILDCEDEALERRFEDIYGEGAVGGTLSEAAHSVKCVVRVFDAAVAAVLFDDPEPLDAFAFCQSLFPDRGYVEGPAGAHGWRTIALRQTPREPQIALCDDYALVDRRQLWQPFIANYAVNRVLRLQREVLFFHAASIGIEGCGALIVGPKASGKTTTALALAARGHDFLGDEVAAVHSSTRTMLPFRRAVSIRAGPRARQLDDQLTSFRHARETFPDGVERTLVKVGSLFPRRGALPTTLSCVTFLRQFAELPTAEPFTFGLHHVRLLSPLAASMWGMPAGARIVDLSRLLQGVRCYFLDPAQPEATAELVEQIIVGAR
jgi:hypothetical protein